MIWSLSFQMFLFTSIFALLGAASKAAVEPGSAKFRAVATMAQTLVRPRQRVDEDWRAGDKWPSRWNFSRFVSLNIKI